MKKLASVTPAHLVAHVGTALKRPWSPGKSAFTLVLGAGFSYGLVPLTRQMMREEIGAWAERELDASLERKRSLTAQFWRHFNAQNERYGTSCRVVLDADGLPSDATAAYQTVSKASSQEGLGTVQDARTFLREMVAQSQKRLNGAHFFLAALLDAQRRAELVGKRPFCRTIFTTNFDPLLQTSLQLMGLLYYMTDRPELALNAGHMVEDESAIHLIYTHGSVHRPYLANTEEELEHLCTCNAPIYSPYLEERGVIVVGYSGWTDSLMAALKRCTNFAANLYWCDVFPECDALDRLSPEARDLLTSGRGGRFYVPLGSGGADALMGLFFQELVPSRGIPRLLMDPFSGLADQLSGLSLAGLTLQRYDAGAEREQVSIDEVNRPDNLEFDAEDLRLKAVDALQKAGQRLEAMACHAGPAPAALPQAAAAPGDVSSSLLSAALERALAGDLERAITIWSTVVDLRGAPVEHVVSALVNRGLAHGQRGDCEREIADYTTVVHLPGAPQDQVGRALVNRGLSFGRRGDVEHELQDYGTLIDLPGAPPALLARALVNRATTFASQGRIDDAIADYDRVIGLPGVPTDMVGAALINRGIAYGRRDQVDRELEDYTRVVELPGASTEHVVKALLYRAVTYGQQDEHVKTIDDCGRVIDLPGAPNDYVAKALLERGVAHARRDEATKAVDDYTRVIEMPGVGTAQVSQALFARAFTYSCQGRTDAAIADYSQLIALPGTPSADLARALANRGWLHYQDGHGDPGAFLADTKASLEALTNGETFANLGLAYCFAGNDAAGLRAYRRFREGAPSAEALETARSDVAAASTSWLGASRAAAVLQLLAPDADGEAAANGNIPQLLPREAVEPGD
jgi:tetratricopeptide (TPR) repeat protein